MRLRAKLLRASKILSRKGLSIFLEEQLALVRPGAKVLNVGAGGEIHDLVQIAAEKGGLFVVSTDIDPTRNPDVVDDISQSSFPDGSFDAVVIMEVLEHVRDPFRAASEIYRLLKPEGRLVLSAPFIFPLHDRPYDFFRFTKYGLAHIFCDFEVLDIRERNSWGETMLVLVARLAKEPGRWMRLISPVLVMTTLLLVPIVGLICRFLPSDYLTIGYTVSGRKGA